MKEYWSIPGPSKAPLEHCLAFKSMTAAICVLSGHENAVGTSLALELK